MISTGFSAPPDVVVDPAPLPVWRTFVGWDRCVTARALARAFTPPPDMPIWQWADQNVMLLNEDAAEPGPYRSAKTPWTRRLQDLYRHRLMWVFNFEKDKWERVRVTEVNVMKSSQSGFSEACLNGIRWRASFRPCNIIYAIDTAEEAKKIARRLLRSFQFLDPSIYTGDPDDIKTTEFLLRGMELLFYGSFSEGKFANKQAPDLFADEVEEHGAGNTLKNLASRKKTATGGIQINLSKPKKENGPIHVAFKRGNQEEFHVPCPHCGHYQFFTFFTQELETPFSDTIDEIRDEQTGELLARLPRPLPLGQTRKIKTGRVVFEHCRNIFGQWDDLRILRETYYECAECKGHIEEHHKQQMNERGEWWPTAIGMPGVVSQHMSDLYSTDSMSSHGQIAIEWRNAKDTSREELQGVYNHRFGWVWLEEVSRTEKADITRNIAGRTIYRVDGQDEQGRPYSELHDDEASANAAHTRILSRCATARLVKSFCPPYQRGTIPFVPRGFLLGSDVGGNYAKWAVGAVMENEEDIAVIDWGSELDPDSIAEIMMTNTWPCSANGKRYAPGGGFLDAKFRKGECLRACLSVPGRKLMPTTGEGGVGARGLKTFTAVPVVGMPGLLRLDVNGSESRDEFFIERIRKKRRRVFFPIDVESDPEFMAELTADEKIDGPNGQPKWNEFPPPNHFADAVRNIVNGLRYLTRLKIRIANPKGSSPSPSPSSSPSPV